MGRHAPILSTTLFFRSEYGLDILMEAVARLRRDYPRLGCLVMGSGDRSEPLALIDRRGLHAAVHLAGDLPHDECVKVIARSNVFVRPTRADGDSISVREAVSLGVPTVASRVGTRPEGVHTFLVGDVDGLVLAIKRALGTRRPTADAGGEKTLRQLLALYEGKRPHDLTTPEWMADFSRRLVQTTGITTYARTNDRE
jgi:glycosyltransferase involved in cell wall biosynthesis